MAKIQIPAVGEAGEGGKLFAQQVSMAASGGDVDNPTATGAVELVDVNVGAHGNVTVHEVAVEVTTPFVDAGGTSATNVTIVVGDGSDPDGFLQSADIAPLTATAASSKGSDQPYAGLKNYTADDTIDVTVGGAAPASQGALELTVIYSFDVD